VCEHSQTEMCPQIFSNRDFYQGYAQQLQLCMEIKFSIQTWDYLQQELSSKERDRLCDLIT